VKRLTNNTAVASPIPTAASAVGTGLLANRLTTIFHGVDNPKWRQTPSAQPWVYRGGTAGRIASAGCNLSTLATVARTPPTAAITLTTPDQTITPG
jgi:hypothetical protein